MAGPSTEMDDEPLDPKVEAIRVKMMRLLMVSGGIMMLGLMAVVIAIVYKINQGAEGTAAPSSAAGAVSIELPQGAEILETSLDDGRIMLRLKLPNGGQALRVHGADGQLLSEYELR